MRLDIRKDPGYEPYLFERSARFAGALLEAHEMDQIGAYLGVGHEVRVPETVRALALENDDVDIAPRRQIPLNFRRHHHHIVDLEGIRRLDAGRDRLNRRLAQGTE